MRGPVALLCAILTFAGAVQAETLLQRGNRYDPASLDPHKYNTTYEAAIILDLFEGLTAFGPDAQPRPGVAESWTASADGKTWAFRLRPGLRWSDGGLLTASDVVYSFRRLMDPKTAAVYASLMYILKNGRLVNTGAVSPDQLGVTAPGPDTVVISLDAPAPYLPQLLANAFLAVVPQHAVKKTGPAWTKPENMISNGAFGLKEWTPQNRVVLARNPRFHDAREVHLDGVVYTPTSDLAAAVVRFRAGELDTQLDLPGAQIELLRRQLPGEIRITPSLVTYYLALNTTVPKLADPRVRRALSMAIDRDVLADKVLRTGDIAATGWVPPAISNYEPARMPFVDESADRRLAQARALLTQAGYGPGHPLQLTYSHSNVADIKRIAVAIAAMWKRVGVECALLGTEGKVHFANLRQGNFEVGYAGWTADFDDAGTFLGALQSNSASNYSRYKNALYDALVTQVSQAAEPRVRAELLHQAEVMMLADQPIVPLMVGASKSLVSRRVQGWQPNPLSVSLSRYLSVDRGGPSPQ